MSRPSTLSRDTIEEMKEYRRNGFTFTEISKIVGVPNSTVRYTLKNNPSEMKPVEKTIDNHTNNTPMPPKTNNPVKASLSDFQPCDLIKHLYNPGYRIENNQLIFKQTVNLKDIINA